DGVDLLLARLEKRNGVPLVILVSHIGEHGPQRVGLAKHVPVSLQLRQLHSLASVTRQKANFQGVAGIPPPIAGSRRPSPNAPPSRDGLGWPVVLRRHGA